MKFPSLTVPQVSLSELKGYARVFFSWCIVGIVLVSSLFLLKESFFQGDQYRRGKFYLRNKHYDKAYTLFLKVYKKKGPITDYALYYAAESAWKAKKLPEAEHYFQVFRDTYPAHPYHDKALFRLVGLKTQVFESLTTEERFGYARGLFNEREYGPALVQFQALSRSSMTNDQKGEVWHYAGLCYFYLRQYHSAAQSFSVALRYPHQYRAKSLWWLARTYQRLNRYQEAIVRYRQIAQYYPQDELAPQAIGAIADLYTALGWYGSASATYAQLRKLYPNNSLAGESYWWQAWNQYRQGNVRGAYALFTEGAARAGDTPYGAALCFWSGKTAEKIGDTAAAQSFYQRTVSDYDHNYYAFRASQKASIPMPTLAQGTLPWKLGISPWGERYQALLVQKAFDDAQVEIKEALATADSKVKAQTYYELAAAALSVGAYLEALGFMERSILTRAIPVKDLPLSFWRTYYPRPFYKHVKDAGRRYHVDIHLLYGLIREESMFTPDIMSWVGARGLMQLMPTTAQMLLKRRDFPLDMLFDPQLNVDLGTKYLAGLLKEMNNDPVAALCGYNAGPHITKRWMKLRSMDDVDEWIELIPYPETRNYVKRVMRSYFEYYRIYGRL